LFTQLILVVELNMLEIEKIQSLLEMNIEIQKMIYGFKNSLMSK
jgi:hypothetical protein